MSNLVERMLQRLGAEVPGGLSMPGDARFAAATATWAKPVGRMPRVVIHCQSSEDVQWAIRIARDYDLPLSVRGGGHDWAGRALCHGLIIDLSGMNGAFVNADRASADIGGGARAADVAGVMDPFGAAVTAGSCGAVGMAGLTLGGGYGSLIGRFGLALDNLLSAEVVLADGRVVVADSDNEPELFWALRGGGGNFGVVTSMRHRLHDLPSVRSGMVVFPFVEARGILQRCAEIAASAPDALTAQVAFAVGPDGAPIVMVVPTWSGAPEDGETRLAPFLGLGTLLAGSIDIMTYGASLRIFDAFIVDGLRTFMETCWLPAIESRSIDVLIHAIQTVVSPGCAILTHEFRGAAARIPLGATAFGLRRDHVLIEILASFVDRGDKLEEQRHRQWAKSALRAFEGTALPGGYPNFLAPGDAGRAARSFGSNAQRLVKAKQHYDPDNVFRSAIPLPARHSGSAVRG